MIDQTNTGATGLPDGNDDSLDAGLRAAFGADSPADDGLSVVDRLRDTIGVRPRILLADADEERSPIHVPNPLEAEELDAACGRYEVLGEIARGGVGVVLRGRDRDLGRDVALKMLRTDHMTNGAMLQRFVEEAQIAGQLQHPGVLPVFELGLSDRRRPYFAMKLVRGRTLSALLQDRSDPVQDRDRLIGVFEQVCQTIAYAHAKGVIHRDLKPSNVMVGAFGEVQVVDWGLAKVLARGGIADESRPEPTNDHSVIVETVRSSHGGSQSIAGSIMGTPAYMPPEQARGEVRLVDERSDVFALGAILCEILTGKPPYVGERSQVLRMAADADLSDARARLNRCGADDDLVALALECLSADRSARPRDAGVVARRIAEHQAKLGERARASELQAARAAARADQERRARRLTLALAASVILAVLLAATGLLWVQREREVRFTADTRRVNEAVERAAMLLGRAKASPVGRMESWDEALGAGEQLESLLESTRMDDETQRRARAFLGELDLAHRDRKMLERIEDIVIVGATHNDRESWLWMYDAFVTAFREYGIDFLVIPKEESARLMRESAISDRLVDGFELWIGTAFQLGSFGVRRHSLDDMLGYVRVMYLADTDPTRTELRRLFYTGRPDLQKLRDLTARIDFEKTLPRTLSWLASAYAVSGDYEGANDVFRRAVLLYPDDFMLNYDVGYVLVPQKKWQEAIRSYMRCLTIRPRTGGVWRALGIALREVDDLNGSFDALQQSIRYQPDHPHTHIDLGITLERMERWDDALASYDEAIRLHPGLPLAHGRRGLLLQKQGRLDDALAALERCHELGRDDPSWKEPSQEWLDECRNQMENGE